LPYVAAINGNEILDIRNRYVFGDDDGQGGNRILYFIGTLYRVAVAGAKGRTMIVFAIILIYRHLFFCN
jgi:hypothetical protein